MSITEGAIAARGTTATPDGPFTVIVTPDGTVLASGWTEDAESLIALIHPDLRPDSVHADPAAARAALEAVEAYYAGDLEAPRRIPVRQKSAEYRSHAWSVLRDVAPGEKATYTDYAARTGRPAAVRAAAGACAMNAAALFVPCHRIVRTDGGLGGFRYGLEIKESLLRREGAAGI